MMTVWRKKVPRISFILFYFLYLLFYFFFIFKLYIIVLVLPNIKMNPPQVYMCSPSWTLLSPPSPFHPSGSLLWTNHLSGQIKEQNLCQKHYKLCDPTATWMDLGMNGLTILSTQTEKDRYHVISFICRIYLKKWYKWTYL